MAQGGSGATTQLNLSTYDTTTNLPNCSLIATDNGNYGATFQIKQKTAGADANAQFTSLYINASGNIGLGTDNPRCKLEVAGIANINNGSPYATVNNYMQSGSLTIGGTNANYGGGTNWNSNTAGLLMECNNNTEIAVHDANDKVSSLIYFEGGPGINKITIGRNMGWGAIANVSINGTLNLTSALLVGENNSFPDIRLGSTNGNNLGIATNAGGFSSSALAGDMVVRSINRLLLQSGGGSTALTINTANNVSMSNDLTVNSTINCTTAYVNGNCTAFKYYCVGETYSFDSNWNGTGSSGWFISMNQFWYTGHAYLKVAISLQNVSGYDNSYCWFGRILLSTNNNGTAPATPGGIIQIITDFRNPNVSATNNNYINVKEKWDGSGNNMLWIEVNNFSFAGNIKVKIS